MGIAMHSVARAWLMYPTWLGYSETLELQRPADAYAVEEAEGGDRWVCRTKDDGTVVYDSIGPIRIVDEPIPF